MALAYTQHIYIGVCTAKNILGENYMKKENEEVGKKESV